MFRIRIKKQENPKGILLKSNTVEITHTVKGTDGADGQSAYDLWLAMGNTGSEADFLASLKGADGKNGADGKDGADGQSAYQLWKAQGNTGTEADFLASLKGADGEKGADGKDGADGQSAYQLWKAQGNTGTEADFISSLKGADGKDGKDANPAQINLIVRQLEELEADVQFKTIEIKNLKTNVGTVEKGTVMPEVKVSWQTNIPATEGRLDRICGVSGTGHQWLGNVTEFVDEVKNIDTTTNYYLTVKDKRGNTCSDKVSAIFCNGLYFGVVTAGAQIDDALLETLTKKLESSRGITFTETAGENQHIAFALPTAYGTPVFKDADQNIGAGFYMAGEFLHTNKSGHKEMYQLWLSTNPKLGTIKIAVS